MSPPTSPADADPRIKPLAVLLLRSGLGINLLNSGLMGHMLARNGPAGGNDNLFPYLQIALGLGLILGIFTMAASAFAGILLLIQPLLQTANLLAGGMGPGPGSAVVFQSLYDSNSASNLLIATAVLWFSHPGYNPWSLDALLFGGRRGRPPAATPRQGVPEPGPGPGGSPPTDERTAAFSARYEGSRDPGSTA